MTTSHAMETIEGRLRRLEDLADIHQLFIDYGRHLDAGNFEAYAALFHEDGAVKLGPMGSAQGRDAIQAMMTDVMAGQVGTAYHIISSPMVKLEGEEATSDVMWTVLRPDSAGTPQVAMVGRHVDVLRRREDRWGFQLRTGHISLPTRI